MPAMRNTVMIAKPYLPVDRVVHVAKEHDLIGRGADLALRSLDERQPQVARRILDAAQVSRDRSVGVKTKTAGGVRILAFFRVELVAKADGVAQALMAASSPVRNASPVRLPPDRIARSPLALARPKAPVPRADQSSA